LLPLVPPTLCNDVCVEFVKRTDRVFSIHAIESSKSSHASASTIHHCLALM
jgi:hypothetical protein